MARTGSVVVSCLLLVLLEYATSSPVFLKEGDPCPSLGGEYSVCRLVRHCPSALEAIQLQRPLPQRCGFSGLEEVVCCPAEVEDREGDDAVSRETRRTNDIPSGQDFTPPDNRRPSLSEGDPCPSLGGESSVCRRVRHCPSAVEAIQQWRPLPQRCGFSGLEEVVCCPTEVEDREGDDADSRGAEHTNDVPTGQDSTSPANQRPSEAACTSYKNMRGPEDHILHGELVEENELPHMAALGYSLPDTEGISWLCGGTLISDQFVVTAAHCCASRVTGRPLRVRMGVNNLTATAESGDYKISEIVMHPNYRRRQYHSDIALLKLDRKVEFSDAVFPACLNAREEDPKSYTAAGWGATNPAGTRPSSALLKTTIYPYGISDCKNTYKEKFPKGMESSLICAGDPEGKTDTCVGDSGTTLVTGWSAPYKAFGVTSLGPKPCGGRVPSLYTRVSHYLDWLEARVWP